MGKSDEGKDGRKYPWGRKFDAQSAYTSESKIGTTSSVGCFPGGASPYGILDLSGTCGSEHELWGERLAKAKIYLSL